MAPVTEIAKRGYTIINFNDNYFYYVLGEAAGYSYPTYHKILKNWNPSMYAQSQEILNITNKFPGVALSIWSDIPNKQSELKVWSNVMPLLLAVNQKENKFILNQDLLGELLTKLIDN